MVVVINVCVGLGFDVKLEEDVDGFTVVMGVISITLGSLQDVGFGIELR